METMSSVLVILLLILGISASASAGVYLRRRLGNSAFMHFAKRPYIGIGATILSIAVMTSFALAALPVPLVAAILVSSAVLAALIWDA